MPLATTSGACQRDPKQRGLVLALRRTVGQNAVKVCQNLNTRLGTLLHLITGTS